VQIYTTAPRYNNVCAIQKLPQSQNMKKYFLLALMSMFLQSAYAEEERSIFIDELPAEKYQLCSVNKYQWKVINLPNSYVIKQARKAQPRTEWFGSLWFLSKSDKNLYIACWPDPEGGGFSFTISASMNEFKILKRDDFSSNHKH
jgi:hypothetical protein